MGGPPLGSLVGKKFGKLLVISEFKDGKKSKAFCRCDCKNECIKDRYTLISKRVRSCGCYRKDRF